MKSKEIITAVAALLLNINTAPTLYSSAFQIPCVRRSTHTYSYADHNCRTAAAIVTTKTSLQQATSTANTIALSPIPLSGYDATDILDYYDRRPWEVTWRLNILGLPLLGWYLSLVMDRLFYGDDQSEALQRKRGEELRQHLVNSGSVALIKSGQALSLRPDLVKNKIWCDELGKLVDEVGAFDDVAAMKIIQRELKELMPQLEAVRKSGRMPVPRKRLKGGKEKSKIEIKFENDPILSLFEFSNGNRAVASASIGQVYKARLRRGPLLEAAIGKNEAAKWGGKTVAIKVQRPNASASLSLDMYLIRNAAMWLSKWRGGDLPAIADQFGMQLFGELDYTREANNCERFRALYGDWNGVKVPSSCVGLTRKNVLVQEWVDGDKGPWFGDTGLSMVKTGLKCSVDQLLHTGLFHADPHRGNLLRTSDKKLAFIDFGMMADVSEEERYGLIGLAIGLQNKNLPLVTENLLKLGFLKDTTQVDELIPRLRSALKRATGGTGKASDVNFASLQAELDDISSENLLEFSTPPFFTIIIRSLTILEGFALSVDSKFRLVRGSYPYVLAQLLSPDGDEQTPLALRNLLIRILTVDGKGQRIEWERLKDFLQLAQKAASKTYEKEVGDSSSSASSRQTVDLFFKFLTSKTGLFLKTPLVHELAEAIDGMASTGEANLLRLSNGLIRPLPGGLGPINDRRMEEIRELFDLMVSAASEESERNNMEAFMEFAQEILSILGDEKKRKEAQPLVDEIVSVAQLVAAEVIEIRGRRAIRNVLQLSPAV